MRALLAQQRSHGGWTDSRYAYCPDERITPNVWVAITALCCQALLRHRDAFAQPEQIDAALRRGEAFLLDKSQLNRGRNEDVYADSYRLLHLSRRWQAQASDQERQSLHQAMAEIVAKAQERQRNGGFWAHEYSNAFCTAAMVEGLLAARSTGVAVPDKMLSQAANALASARSEDGSFAYGGAARGKPRPAAPPDRTARTAPPRPARLRMPVASTGMIPSRATPPAVAATAPPTSSVGTRSAWIMLGMAAAPAGMWTA